MPPHASLQAHAAPGSGVPMDRRLEWVAAWRASIASGLDTLLDLMQQERPRDRFEALTAELMTLLAACRWHERHAARTLADRRLPGTPAWMLGQSHKQSRVPLGTVAVIATWNYPVQLMGIQVLQALVAGNRVVVKPSERSPRTQEALLTLARDAWVRSGLPGGSLRWTPADRACGARLLEEPGAFGVDRIDHAVFTGSTAVGRSVAEWGARTLTPTTLELSGRDSALVLDDADPVRAARGVWRGVTLNSGHTCMAPRRALVAREVYTRFVRELGTLAAGSPPAALVDAEHAQTAFGLARDALAHGARSASGVCEPPSGRYLRPLAMVDCPTDAPLVGGRHFGPVLAVVPCTDLDAMLEVHHACDQHLVTSVYTSASSRAAALAPRLGAGTVTVNESVIPTGHPAASIHGAGDSGWGVSRGVEGLLAMTRTVHIGRVRTPTPEAPPMGLGTGWMARWIGRMYGG